LARLGPDDSARWDRFVEGCPDATFFHKTGWRDVIEETLGQESHYIYAERDGRIVGVLPLIHVRSRIFGDRLTSTAFCDRGGPVASDPDARNRLFQEAAAMAARLDVDFLECRCSPPPTSPEWLSRSDLYASFRRELHADPDKNFQALHRKRRAMIRKGSAEGLTTEVDDAIDRHYKIFAVSVRNLGTPVLPKAYFGKLKTVFGEDCEILTILKGRSPVASVMSFTFRDEVLPYHGGSLPEGRDLAANDYMYWEVMRRAAERGLHWFDFGRSKAGTGAYAFKKNWGFAPEPLIYCFHLRRLQELPEINPLNPKYRLGVMLWKRLPLPLSMAIGPYIVRSLG
jgi:FemAB-related protein (PEP-CTERM system-associated)